MSSNYNWWQYPGSNNEGLPGSTGGSNSNFSAPYVQNTSYSPPDTTKAVNTSYNQPLLTNSKDQSASGAWKPSDYLQAMQLIYGISKDKQNAKRASQPPKFIEAPQTDQEKKLWDLFYAQQTNPATVNNRALVSGYAQDMLANMHPTWTPPKTSTGETGYNGNAGMKWPGIPPFDWSNYGKGGAGVGGPAGTVPNGPPGGGGGAPGSDVNPKDGSGGMGGAGARAGIGTDTTTPAGGGGVGGPGPAGTGVDDGVDLPLLQKYGPIAKQLIDKYGSKAPLIGQAVAGPEGALIAKVITWILGKILPTGQKVDPNDPKTWPTDHYTDANTDAAREAARTPKAGSTGTTGDLFQPTDAAAANQGYDFWNGLMNSPGWESPSNFSYHVNVGRKR